MFNSRRGIRLAVSLLVAVPVLQGQFSSLSATDDGSTVYFVTRLRERGSSQPTHGKIFVADASGVHVVAAIEREAHTDVLGITQTNVYDFQSVETNSDGSLLVQNA